MSRLSKPMVTSALIGTLLTASSICSGAGSGASAENKEKNKTDKIAQIETRTLVFPQKSIGALNLVQKRAQDIRGLWASNSLAKPLGNAAGVIKVSVPAGSAIELEPNRRVFDQPLLLKEIPPSGVDILKLNFYGMEEGEENICDRALVYVNGMTNLKALDLDRSDVTDDGLAKLKNLPRLAAISCFFTSINGSCFKKLASLSELTTLGLRNCKIDQKNLIDLSLIAKLKNLSLDNTRLDQSGAKGLGLCTGLVTLSVHGNRHFDDQCISKLSSLKKLEFLDLRDTAVTVKGMSALRGIKLKFITISPNLAAKQNELQAMFPGTTITSRSTGKIGADEKVIFAPLK